MGLTQRIAALSFLSNKLSNLVRVWLILQGFRGGTSPGPAVSPLLYRIGMGASFARRLDSLIDMFSFCECYAHDHRCCDQYIARSRWFN